MQDHNTPRENTKECDILSDSALMKGAGRSKPALPIKRLANVGRSSG
jgi:hypothetical protein